MEKTCRSGTCLYFRQAEALLGAASCHLLHEGPGLPLHVCMVVFLPHPSPFPQQGEEEETGEQSHYHGLCKNENVYFLGFTNL